MKFRWKLMIITMLIVSFSFGFGGMLLIQYSYQVSIKQEKRAARNSYEMILRMLKEINEMDDTYQNQTFASVLKRLNWQGLLRDSSVRLLKEQHGEVQWKQPLYYNRKNDNFRRSNGFSTKQGKAVVFQNKNKVYYQITSKISYGKETMVFQGAYDISEVYATRHQQLVSFRKIFVLVIGIEIVVSYFLAMILTVENGYQAALMVPTEVLANQHFEAFQKLLDQQQIISCRPVLLTGSVTAASKRKIYQSIASGEANVIIGTHALIQEKDRALQEMRRLNDNIADEKISAQIARAMQVSKQILDNDYYAHAILGVRNADNTLQEYPYTDIPETFSLGMLDYYCQNGYMDAFSDAGQ